MTRSFVSDTHDLTLRIKFSTTKRPDLSTSASLLSILRPFGPIDEPSFIFSLKPPKKNPDKPPKFGTALATFERLEDAYGAVGASGVKARGLESVEVGWAKGEEPVAVKRMLETKNHVKNGKLQEGDTATTGARPASPTPFTFSTPFPPFVSI